MENNLQALKNLGVLKIQVKDHIATAVNPYSYHLCTCWREKIENKESMCRYCKLFYDINNLTPLTAPSVPDREYGIDELDEQEQFWNGSIWWPVDNNNEDMVEERGYDLRTVLILKQPEPIISIVCTCGATITDEDIEMNNGTNEEGEEYGEVSATCKCGKEYNSSEWGYWNNLEESKIKLCETTELELFKQPEPQPEKVEQETDEVDETAFRIINQKYIDAGLYEDEIDDVILPAMKEYLSQYKASLIEKLEAERIVIEKIKQYTLAKRSEDECDLKLNMITKFKKLLT